MQKVVGVRFKKAGKIYYFDPDQLELQLGDGIIVETARGVEFGYLVSGPKEVEDEEIVSPLKKVIRKADDSDFRKLEDNEQKAKEAFQIGQEKISKHKLPMKLVNVEMTFDTKKIIFYFTAEGRVDFRDLVKDLASVFRTRIELRQIGVRDEAKMLGGLGLCGRAICCHSFLGEFQPVSIRMAKDQNLSLNPTKISGLCGRLMCCLQYEAEAYKDALDHLPNLGDEIDTPQGKGRVTEVNPLTGEVNVQIEEGVEMVLNLGDNAPNCDGCSQKCAVRKQVTTSDCPLTKEEGGLWERQEVLQIQESEREAASEEQQPNQPGEQDANKNKKRRRRRKPRPKNKDASGQSESAQVKNSQANNPRDKQDNSGADKPTSTKRPGSNRRRRPRPPKKDGKQPEQS